MGLGELMLAGQPTLAARSFAATGCLLFVAFAVVQYNDPDPMPWMLAYGYAAMVCSLGALGINVSLWAVIGVIGYGLGSAVIYPFGHERRWIEIETAREGAGLAIAALWMIMVVAWDHARRHRPLKGAPRDT